MPGSDERYNHAGRLRGSVYDAEMERLQEQLVLLQYWIQSQGLKVLVIFEGRGSAGKGGVIKRITERTSIRSNSGQLRRNSWCSSSLQKPITHSTFERLYQLRSKRTISPAAGRCST